MMAASLPKRLKINESDNGITVEASVSQQIEVEPSDSEVASSNIEPNKENSADSQQIKVEPSDSEAVSNVKIKQFKQVSHEEYLRYLKAARKSQGFDVPQVSNLIPDGVSPLDIDEDSQAFLTMMSKQALDEYNTKENATFQFVKLVKANHQMVAGRMYYIKFEAKEGEGNCQNFRAKVWEKICDKGTEVKFCEKI